MVIIPYYNLIIIPEVLVYFQRDYFKEVAGQDPTEGEQVLMIMLRSEKRRHEVTVEDFYPVGVSGIIDHIDKDGTVTIHIKNRVDVEHIEIDDEMIQVEAAIRPMSDRMEQSEKDEMLREMKQALTQYVQDKQWGMIAKGYIAGWNSINEMFAGMSYHLRLTIEEKYEVIMMDSEREQMKRLEELFYENLEMLKVDDEASGVQAKEHEKLYREEAIKKQISYLQKQLEEMHPDEMTDERKFEKKIEESGMNETARAEARKVLKRMKQEGEHGHEYGMLYDYLDFVTGLSWKKEEPKEIDLEKAKNILDEDHFGMKKVKDRMIQQLAVMQLNHNQAGSILLFVGPPGTGKTSIGQSIAKALDRPYARVSLGGVRDEAEIRGHRRTYVGAMPGRIMDGIRRSGASNPVIVLDEVDKLVREMHGDPSSALLEVLDPEQNNTFTDHYMNVPYDLSDVMFICTANTTDTIPEPLLNRMEVIPFSGYTALEKCQIARKHLLPQSMAKMGITGKQLKITDEAMKTIVSDYTMEAGVRGLRKCMDALCRTAAVKLVSKAQKSITVNPKKLREYLDARPITHERVHDEKKTGVVTGLAWTQSGGDVLFIETMSSNGSGKVQITGQLGDVMKESAQLAVTLVKHLFPEQTEDLSKKDLHIHVPAGAVPKDGPSAGVTLTTALSSLVTGKKVDPHIAMTGEISLQGDVMPIGGLPEKLMAAVRAGITKVFIPWQNKEDLAEIPKEVTEQLEIQPVKRMEEILEAVLED